MLAILS